MKAFENTMKNTIIKSKAARVAIREIASIRSPPSRSRHSITLESTTEIKLLKVGKTPFEKEYVS